MKGNERDSVQEAVHWVDSKVLGVEQAEKRMQTGVNRGGGEFVGEVNKRC